MPEDSTAPGFSGLTIAGKRYVTVERWSRRRTVRWGVFWVFAGASVLAFLVRSSLTLLLWQATLVFCIGFILWPIFHGTYLLHKNQSLQLQAGYSVAGDLSLEEFPHYQTSALQQLGFTFVGCLEKKPNDPRVITNVAIFVREENGDSAQLASVRNSLGTTHLVVFVTRFRSGLVLETSNSFQMPMFHPKPRFRSFRFPQVRTTSDLYLLHRAITKEYDATRTRLRETPENALINFIEAAEENHSLNMEQGDYKLNMLGNQYVFTWRGAFRRSFLRAWPMSSIRQMRVYSQAKKKCAQLGFSINPKLGRIAPIEKS